MKISHVDSRVHVLDDQCDVWTVINNIVDAGKQEDAFYVCNIGDIIRKHEMWCGLLKRVTPHYAVKCNDSITVLEILAGLGAGFDCASKTEIRKVLDLNVRPDRVIFANPAKPSSHIQYAASVGVATMTFDNEVELHKVKHLHPTAKMVIRIRCDAVDAQCLLGMKFGCDPHTEAPYLLQVAHSLGIDVVGVSFHVGSGCRELTAYRRAIQNARDVFNVAATIGHHFTLLDIGGGYPGTQDSLFHKIAKSINCALDEYFPVDGGAAVQVIAEPGRFYVASAYTLACNIHSLRETEEPPPNDDDIDSSIRKMYYINDGVYGSFNCILYDHQKVVPLPLKPLQRPTKYYTSSVWGPTCDGLDLVVENVLLPELQLGDWLIFENMGAYTLPVASPFNGFPVPRVHIVANENMWNVVKDIVSLNDEHFTFGASTHTATAAAAKLEAAAVAPNNHGNGPIMLSHRLPWHVPVALNEVVASIECGGTMDLGDQL